MTLQDVTFVICTERGQLEKISVLFVMPLRMFGGIFSKYFKFSAVFFSLLNKSYV